MNEMNEENIKDLLKDNCKKKGIRDLMYKKWTRQAIEDRFYKRIFKMLKDCFDFFPNDDGYLSDNREELISKMAYKFVEKFESLYKRYDLDPYNQNLADNELPELMMREKYKMIWLVQHRLNGWTWGYDDCRIYFDNVEKSKNGEKDV
jgi:hypothetical protein